ncbi:pyridoxal phosphate-dependent transferase [Aspergillus lucknowensis]|uniref:Pyridoxal phosphate-dependent transferase n=1 Tax=Aspergillus lucknowensis TaxID=176173 RepID=A0ABR4LLY3_9EURO
MLSSRGKRNAVSFDVPWLYAAPPTYNKETNPEGVINFALAEHGPVRSDIAEYINNKVKFNVNSVCYGIMATENPLPAAAASHLNKYLKPLDPIKPEMVVKVNGCTSAGTMLSFALAEPGDGVLISRPVYGRFELDYGFQGNVQIVYADTDADEAFSTSCIEKYEKALQDSVAKGVQIRALLLVNPHNPVGCCYPSKTLIEILKFCNKHQIHLISDEIYATCVFDTGNPDAPTFTSVLSLATPELIDINLVHVLYGFSKDFASGGLRLGFIVSHNAELRRALSAVVRFYSPSAAAETIGTAILQDEEFVEKFTERSTQDLAYSYRIATSILDQEGINYNKKANAGFFIYVDLSPYLPKDGTLRQKEREFTLAQSFLDNGLFLHPGEEHCKDPGWFRLVYSHEEHVLREGLRRLLKTVKSTQ